MNDLIAEDDARRRYETLISALGAEPIPKYHREVFARLAAWWAEPDCEAVATEVRFAIGRATRHCTSLLGEVAAFVPTEIENRDRPVSDLVQVALPVALCMRVRRAAQRGRK